MYFRRRNYQTDDRVTEIPLSETKTTMNIPLHRNARRRNGSAKIWLLTIFLFSVVAFYVGLITGWNNTGNTGFSAASACGSTSNSTNGDASILDKTNDKQAEEIVTLKEKVRNLEQQLEQRTKAVNNDAKIFDTDHTGKFASGIEFVDRDGFAAAFDTGVPLDESTRGNDRVAILYSDTSAFPEKSSRDEGRLLSVEEATSNCYNLHLVLTHAEGRKHQCIAIMGQYESFHVHKFMRIDGENGKIDAGLPLKYTSRGRQQNGRISAKIPGIDQTKEHWGSLVPYLQSLETVQEELKPVLKDVSSHNDNNAVIVMVCNFGQSDLLLNFVCNARAKGLDDALSNVVLFATDEKTHDLAKFMGITSVYLGSIFGSMPEKAAGRYADQTFRAMMIAKVYCIQIVSMLGYDILFQDVDVVWYQNPLPWFHNKDSPHYSFDMYFQDDGNHALFYAPYSANTGFYYVRNNDKTQYFFNSFLMHGDRIISSGSHQIPLIAHLSEHASLHGLRVKTWGRDQEEFPGGYTFHSRKHKDFLKDVMRGEAIKRGTHIFHMSWTSSKVNKVKFYQQMGEWYLQNTCSNRKPSGIEGAASDCCAAKPIVTCHFRDKASKIPCKESPPIDKGGRSWW